MSEIQDAQQINWKGGTLRIGIIAYALWLLIVGWQAYAAINPIAKANDEERQRIDACVEGRTDLVSLSGCGGARMVGDERPPNAPLPIFPYILLAFAPPILLLAGRCAVIWVKRGFKPKA